MSDITHAEFLRNEVARYLKHQEWDVVDRVRAIADLLDTMQWRDEPPDSEGMWLGMTKEQTVVVLTIPREAIGDIKEYVPGDRWLKLPEVTG